MASNDEKWVDVEFFLNEQSNKFTPRKKSDSKTNDRSNVLTGFKCSGYKCNTRGIWNVNGYKDAKKSAIEAGWSFGSKKGYCPECTKKRERMGRITYNPPKCEKRKANSLMDQSIFKD